MQAIGIVSIAISGLVAVVAMLAQVWQQRKGFAHERQMDDRASVRNVLSEAATVLHRLEYALDDVRSTLSGFGARFFESEERAKPYRELEAVGREMDAVLGQLRIRLGPGHPATLAFNEAFAASLDIFRALGLIKMEDPAISGTYGAEQVSEMVAEQRERITQQREIFDSKATAFVKLAHAAAGAQLPSET